jgi:hypothetical protein
VSTSLTQLRFVHSNQLSFTRSGSLTCSASLAEMTLVPNKKLGQKNTARRRLVVRIDYIFLPSNSFSSFESKRIASYVYS